VSNSPATPSSEAETNPAQVNLASGMPAATATRVDESPKVYSLPGWAPPLFFAILAILFLWRSCLTSSVFLPADMLKHVSPWNSAWAATADTAAKSASLPPWNPLRWDGIAQFYPWRLFAIPHRFHRIFAALEPLSVLWHTIRR
jgi:hypothetical protein